MQVSLQFAKEHFADLVSAVNRGEDVEIAQPEKPTLKLVALSSAPPDAKSGRRILGVGRGELRIPTFEEWQAMDADIWRDDPPLMTTGEV